MGGVGHYRGPLWYAGNARKTFHSFTATFQLPVGVSEARTQPWGGTGRLAPPGLNTPALHPQLCREPLGWEFHGLACLLPVCGHMYRFCEEKVLKTEAQLEPVCSQTGILST